MVLGIQEIREGRAVAGFSQSSPKVSGPFCAEMWPHRTRATAYWVFHPIHEGGLVGVDMPCGFCGGECTHRSQESRQIPGCCVWLREKSDRRCCSAISLARYSHFYGVARRRLRDTDLVTDYFTKILRTYAEPSTRRQTAPARLPGFSRKPSK